MKYLIYYLLIELFSYLSSTNTLWGFTRLNCRLTMLITERGFFYYVNLSITCYHQLHTILRFLLLNNIQSLVIDSDASPLQLTHWSYMPRLKTLRSIGIMMIFYCLFCYSSHFQIKRKTGSDQY
jgi:hypothetical protein